MIGVFIVSVIVGSLGAYSVLRYRAINEAARESQLLLSTASAIRTYTAERLSPLLASVDQDAFVAESVPSFAAHSIFADVAERAPGYNYREAALNPTNPDDLALPFEVELIAAFRADADLAELNGLTRLRGEHLFYAARPIRIESPACLSCHSSPESAPASLIADYGASNGFGWQLNEIVGVQVLTVPVTQELRTAYEVVLLFVGGLSAIFLIAYLLVSNTIEASLIAPLRRLTRSAEDASVGAMGDQTLPREGGREVHRLAGALDRLRTSLRKALGSTSGPAED